MCAFIQTQLIPSMLQQSGDILYTGHTDSIWKTGCMDNAVVLLAHCTKWQKSAE